MFAGLPRFARVPRFAELPRRELARILLRRRARPGGLGGVFDSQLPLAVGELDQHVPAMFTQPHVAGVGQLLREIAEAADAVGALREGRVELQQRALQQAELRRDLAIAQHLQRPPHQPHDLLDRRLAAHRTRLPAAIGTPTRSHQVLVSDELVTVPLHHHASERAAADHEDLLVVLLQLFDQRDEVAVAADDDVGVDVGVGEGHLQRVERQVDVRPVLVAPGRQVALHQLGGVLGQRTAVVAGARPVAVGDLRYDLAALLQGFEHDADVELCSESALDADFDVVEIDEYRQLQSCVRQTLAFLLIEVASGLIPTRDRPPAGCHAPRPCRSSSPGEALRRLGGRKAPESDGGGGCGRRASTRLSPERGNAANSHLAATS